MLTPRWVREASLSSELSGRDQIIPSFLRSLLATGERTGGRLQRPVSATEAQEADGGVPKGRAVARGARISAWAQGSGQRPR